MAKKRWLKFVFDGEEKLIEIDRCTSLRGDVKKVLLHLDELEDGRHLLIVSEKLWDVGSRKLLRIEVVRGEEHGE